MYFPYLPNMCSKALQRVRLVLRSQSLFKALYCGKKVFSRSIIDQSRNRGFSEYGLHKNESFMILSQGPSFALMVSSYDLIRITLKMIRPTRAVGFNRGAR